MEKNDLTSSSTQSAFQNSKQQYFIWAFNVKVQIVIEGDVTKSLLEAKRINSSFERRNNGAPKQGNLIYLGLSLEQGLKCARLRKVRKTLICLFGQRDPE